MINFEFSPRRRFEVALRQCMEAYEPESVLIRSGRWKIQAREVDVILQYQPRGGESAFYCRSSMPEYFSIELLPQLFRQKLYCAERMLEECFTS